LEAGQKCLDARHLKFGEVRRTRKYAATTMNEGNAADGYFSSAYERRGEQMPTYDYRCPGCKKKFSVMMTIREHDAKKVKCPKCGTKKVEQQISHFMTKTSRKG
jgi:putative FmdB family regulatory protein